ncbi:MAG: flavin reductase family protein [Planctomycetes bacterium]|nr:flavin reductase family protein [Planctomycetota bacterium]
MRVGRNGDRAPAAGKSTWKPGNVVVPAPAALVSCQRPGERPNCLTVAWCGNVNSDPAMLSISVRPSRHSHAIIRDTGEFVVNIPSRRLAWAVDYCGVASGREVDKFTHCGLTPATMAGVACPAVAECPIGIACRVEQRVPLGSHDLFLATVTEVMVESALLEPGGRFALERADLLCYAHGFYYTLGRRVGHFGWSVRKKTASGKVRHGKSGKKP